MKKILIAGEAGQTTNYENALAAMQVHFVTSLQVKDVDEYDGLLLPGGGDVDPKLFGQLLIPETEIRQYSRWEQQLIRKGQEKLTPELDRIQLAILKAFCQYRKPVFGICKGMQLINIAFGGDMLRHLPTAVHHAYREKDQMHPARNEVNSFLYEVYGSDMLVNSAHHQGVGIPGRGIRYVQYAPDGVVEGLQHEFLPVYGVQWHPERLERDIKKLKKQELYTYGNNGVYTKDILDNDNIIINKLSNNKSKYCLLKEKNSTYLNICNNNNMLVVIPSVTGGYNNIKNNLTGGSIILLEDTSNIDIIIKYINSKGYTIVPLSKLLTE